MYRILLQKNIFFSYFKGMLSKYVRDFEELFATEVYALDSHVRTW